MSTQWDCLSYLKTLIDNIDWVITDSNKDIYFKYDEGEATKLTLTTGVYSTTEFETHLESLIDTAFSESSSVSYSSNKFTIAVSENHTIQYIHTNSTLDIGFTEDSSDEQSITSDTSIFVYFKYVDYLTEENANKIGKRFPAVLIKDSNEEWEEAGSLRYDIWHDVDLYLYNNINQDRLETLNTDQSVLTEEIIDNNTLDSNAICVRVMGVDKGDYYTGEVDMLRAGYNDNISVRIINIRIWEQI